MINYPDYRHLDEEEMAESYKKIHGYYPMYREEYQQALFAPNHPKHKIAMQIRAKNLAKQRGHLFTDEQNHWNKVRDLFRTLLINPFN